MVALAVDSDMQTALTPGGFVVEARFTLKNGAEYVVSGVPVVAAAVGVNREIVADGVNGFLAATPDEWVNKLERLLAINPGTSTSEIDGVQTREPAFGLPATWIPLDARETATAAGRTVETRVTVKRLSDDELSWLGMWLVCTRAQQD